MSHPPCCDRDLWRLPALDVEAVTAGAGEWVAEQLGTTSSPQEQASAAAALIDTQLAVEFHAAVDLRDRAAWTIVNSYHVRRGAKIPEALGVNRTAWKKIRDRLTSRSVEAVPDAVERLPALAAAAAVWRARLEAATNVRDEAVRKLIALDWANHDIARLIERDPSRVSTLRHHKVPVS